METERRPRQRQAARNVLLKIHLFLGLTAATFLLVLGVTGSIMAFEGDIDHWLNPRVWFVTPGPQSLPQADLIRSVQQQFAPARVTAVQIFRRPNLVEQMQLSDRSTAFVNPYTGAVAARRTGPSQTQKILASIHQFHLRLVFDPRAAGAFAETGKKVVSFAGLLLLILVPIGVILWWRTKRATIRWDASWFRACFDIHNAVGIYASLFLFIAALTGVLIGFDSGEAAIYSLTNSSRPAFAKPPPSVAVPGATPISIDQALETAKAAMPDARVSGFMLPGNAKGSYVVLMRVPEETSEAVHSNVTIDQYSGKVLRLVSHKTESLGYRVIRFNRSIHTGDVLGWPTHILMSLSSLVLVTMVLTGVVIWWKKLAV